MERPIFIGQVKQVEDVGSCPLFMGDVDASEALDLHRTALISGERGQRRWPRFLRFRAIGRRRSNREMDGSYSSRNSSLKIDVLLFFSQLSIDS